MPPRASAVLLDLDGTISDNYPGISRSIAHALERLGVAPATEAHLRACVGPPLRESFRRLLATDDAGLVERAIGFYRERFAEVGWQENVVYPGIAEALPGLAASSSLYVCTAKPDLFARRIIERLGFAGHFTAIYGADLAGRLDDKADLLAHLAQEQGIDPTTAVMVGDRAHDIRAARRNGARAIGVLWGYGSAEELAEADALVAAPHELAGAITRVRAARGCE